MMEVFIIVFDYDPAGDYLVKAARMTGMDTEEEKMGRAASVEQARSLLPPGLEPVDFWRGDSRYMEIWL